MMKKMQPLLRHARWREHYDVWCVGLSLQGFAPTGGGATATSRLRKNTRQGLPVMAKTAEGKKSGPALKRVGVRSSSSLCMHVKIIMVDSLESVRCWGAVKVS